MRFSISLILAMVAAFAVRADTVIHNVTVLPMDGSPVIENAHVRIDGDRIVHISATAVPTNSGSLTIDGTGKFLIPGLAELHGHLPSAGPNHQNTRETLFLYLAGGVTTVRGMLGNPVQFEMRSAIEAGTLDGPTLYLAAPSLNGNTAPTPERAVALVRKYQADGYDLLKIHPGIPREAYVALADTANELGMPFGGHVPADVGIELALRKGQISIDHMDGFIGYVEAVDHPITDEELSAIVDVYKAHEPSWIVPTQALFSILIAGGDADALAARPENNYMPPATRASWARRIQTAGNPEYKHVPANRDKALRALADAGARIVMGSDAPQLYSVPGFSIKREIEALVAAGFSAGEILKIATVNAGAYFADKDTFGVIKVGARADLILLDADPRADIMNIMEQAGVMAAGRWYSREAIDARLQEIEDRHRG